jgi:hypothetical protein
MFIFYLSYLYVYFLFIVFVCLFFIYCICMFIFYLLYTAPHKWRYEKETQGSIYKGLSQNHPTRPELYNRIMFKCTLVSLANKMLYIITCHWMFQHLNFIYCICVFIFYLLYLYVYFLCYNHLLYLYCIMIWRIIYCIYVYLYGAWHW